MKKKFDVYEWMTRQVLTEADEEGLGEMPVDPTTQQPAAAPSPPQQNPPTPQKPPTSSGNTAFRSLAGKTISGVSFKANGDSGGEISILTKNSYVPFKVSWVNQNVTITDLNGNIINIGEE